MVVARTATLRTFTRADLEVVEPWFDDPDTRRFLGDRHWPGAMLDLAETAVGREFRGALQTGAYRFLAVRGGAAVGYIDCGTFDCWTPPVLSRSRLEVIEGPAGSIAFVVAPSARRQGVAKAMIEALLARPELADLRIVGAGVEPDNTASIATLTSAGFAPQLESPDDEGMLYFIRRPKLAAGAGRATLGHAPDRFEGLSVVGAERGPRRGGSAPGYDVAVRA